jgi:N utilization substance protein A
MNNDFLAVLEYMENDRQIARETLIEVIEESLLMAARKAVGPANELRVKINPETGDINAWAQLEVVERVTEPEREIAIDEVHRKLPDAKLGDMVDWEVTPEDFGRIAAQTAKQVIMQKLRQVERVRVCKEFADRIGELVSGVVTRNERGEVLVNIPHAEAVMPYAERIPGEEYQVGDHFTGLLLRINEDQPGPSLVLSRSNPEFVRRLFEREVAEIGEGLVEIKAVAREAGYRTKIAVTSKDSSVDPVGACVGLRGNRVKSIVRELAGEKVDIILWSAKIHEFVGNALQPAKLARVRILEDEHLLQVDVPEDQLSLAIGKRGQNARLAAKLTGWRIDIQKLRSDEEVEFESKVQQAVKALASAVGIDSELAGKLVSMGFVTAEGLATADVDDLVAIEGLDEERAAKILEKAKQGLAE